jgi:hypothetical protein
MMRTAVRIGWSRKIVKGGVMQDIRFVVAPVGGA